jgi:hypothetical protein
MTRRAEKEAFIGIRVIIENETSREKGSIRINGRSHTQLPGKGPF